MLNRRKSATVLAALRFWQRFGPKSPDQRYGYATLSEHEQDLFDEIRTNGGRHDDLSLDEIDALCEQLNTDEE